MKIFLTIMTKKMKFNEYYKHYLSLHQNKTCILLHYLGQWATIGVIYLIIKYHLWLLIPIVPFVVYPFAWSGHYFFEKNKPAAFKNPWLAKLSDWRMFLEISTGKIKLF